MSISSTVCDPMALTDNSGGDDLAKRVELKMMMMPDGLEHMFHYDTGGHHPVHLGDSLGPEGRFRVLYKLGTGGFANVWLCRDTQTVHPRYVALKILMAEFSTDDCPEFCALKFNDLLESDSERKQNICLPTDSFRIEGPNGSHLCFVYPLLGGSIWAFLQKGKRREASLRQVALQVTRALATLHEFGLCHGDLTPSNVLLRTTGLDGLPENEVVKILGESMRAPITTMSEDEHHEPRAPQYLVYPVNLTDIGLTDDAFIIDFGQSFESANPPEKTGIPVAYSAPELILKYKPGKSSDLWALGATLFEIRSGSALFDMYNDDADDYLLEVVLRLGKLPEHLWSEWNFRNVGLEEEADELGRVIVKHDLPNAAEVEKWLASVPRSLKEAVVGRSMKKPCPDESQPTPVLHKDFAEKETDCFADLLGKLMSLEPEKRLSAREASEHEWFKLSEEEHKTNDEGTQAAEVTSEAIKERQETDEEGQELSEVEQKPREVEQTSVDEQKAGMETQEASTDAQVPDQEGQNSNQAAPRLVQAEQETIEKKESRRVRRHSI